MDNENRYIEVFDAREDGLKCVHFESGNVGVVDEHGEVIYQIDKCRHIEFAEHDFLKLKFGVAEILANPCLLYTSPSPRDLIPSRMPSSA